MIILYNNLVQVIKLKGGENNGTKTDEWKFVITFINLDVNQNANTGKELKAKLIIQSEKRNYLAMNTSGDTYRSDEYRNYIKEVEYVNYIAEDIEDKTHWDLSTDKDNSMVAWLEDTGETIKKGEETSSIIINNINMDT